MGGGWAAGGEAEPSGAGSGESAQAPRLGADLVLALGALHHAWCRTGGQRWMQLWIATTSSSTQTHRTHHTHQQQFCSLCGRVCAARLRSTHVRAACDDEVLHTQPRHAPACTHPPFLAPTHPSPTRSEEVAAPKIRFRNYEPKTEELQEHKIANAVAPKLEDLVPVAEVIHNDATQEPLLNLAPKRPNWDLKRDLEPQQKKLRAMTDRAIVQLIGERVAAEAADSGGPEGPDLAAAVDRVQKAEEDQD